MFPERNIILKNLSDFRKINLCQLKFKSISPSKWERASACIQFPVRPPSTIINKHRNSIILKKQTEKPFFNYPDLRGKITRPTPPMCVESFLRHAWLETSNLLVLEVFKGWHWESLDDIPERRFTSLMDGHFRFFKLKLSKLDFGVTWRMWIVMFWIRSKIYGCSLVLFFQ